MADEVTKKDLQSLQGWVNAKLAKIEKSIADLEEANAKSSKLDNNTFATIVAVRKALDQQVAELDKRVTKIEKAK